MEKLDAKDKKVLYELDKNSRQPLSKIAKKVSLSRESILYRLKRYIKQGIIQNYLVVVNLAKFGRKQPPIRESVAFGLRSKACQCFLPSISQT